MFLGLAILILSAPRAEAKGNGVGLWMEGTVSNVQPDGHRVRFLLTGIFRFEQYRGTSRSVVEVDGRRGMLVTIRQADPFFAMTTDWRGGAIRDGGALFRILESATKGRGVVKFELSDAQLAFGPGGTLTVVDGAVRRATDASLR
jgi:hypothetical protein